MSSPAPICQCGEVVDVKGPPEDNLSSFCTKCRNIVLALSLPPKKEPSRNRARRKPRTGPPGERLLESLPGVSRGAMVDSRRALHENYSRLYAREQQLLQAVAELENQMALRNQSLPKPAPTPNGRTVQGRPGPSGKSSPTDLDVDLLADAFGVVSMRDNSNVQFVGPTANSEYILQQCDALLRGSGQPSRRRSPKREKVVRPPLKCFENFPEIIFLDMQFPCPPPQPPSDLRRFLPHLPDFERAQRLVDNYVYFVTWFVSPIPLSDLPEILNLIYPNKSPTEHIDLSKGHRLASLFAVFIFGSHFDMDMSDEQRMTDCAMYMTLARATMSSVPLSEHATVPGIQCMVLLIWFSRFSPNTSSVGYQWAFSGFLAKLVQSLGLHTNGRDDYAYIQDEKTIQRAEQVFWEYYMQDIFQSYAYGRPVTLHPSVITCRWPEVEVDDGHHPDFFKWKYSMTMIMAEIIETTGQPTVAYGAILKLDRQTRHHSIPFGLEWPNPDGETKTRYEPIGRTIQRAFGSIFTQMILMVLHRPYLWEAISKRNHNLMQHRYWRSVVAAYHGASSLVSSTLTIWRAFPGVIERIAPFWSHCHSGALVLGALVTLRPDSQFARESLRHLDATCEMFRAANEAGSHLGSRLSALYRLQKKAQDTYSNYIISEDISTPEVLSPASLSCLEDLDHVDPNSKGSHDDNMELDPGVYRLQEKGWDHLILQLGRNN